MWNTFAQFGFQWFNIHCTIVKNIEYCFKLQLETTDLHFFELNVSLHWKINLCRNFQVLNRPSVSIHVEWPLYSEIIFNYTPYPPPPFKI